MLKTLHVGIDVSRARHDLCLLDESGTPLGRSFAVANNRPGAAELVGASQAFTSAAVCGFSQDPPSGV